MTDLYDDALTDAERLHLLARYAGPIIVIDNELRLWLHHIAHQWVRMERQLDELVANAQEDAAICESFAAGRIGSLPSGLVVIQGGRS